jgi:light-regulated signal transduction histidine kinase (bacteriophytochrome)
MANILPYFEISKNEINDGEVYTFHDFCKSKFGSRCLSHYKKIEKPGFFECPFGFFAYATRNSLNNNKIYSSIFVTDLVNKKLKGRGFIKNRFSQEELSRLIGLIEQDEKKQLSESESNMQESELVRGVFHEIRRLSRDLDASGTFFQMLSQNTEDINTQLVDNILQTIKLISIRIDSYELLKNPATITSGKQPNIRVYKKFDKSRYILTSLAKRKNTYINFNNESHFSIDGYDIFDLLPYIILDNALKYSPDGTSVELTFYDQTKTVLIVSLGPQLSPEEHLGLFERGFRGKNCQKYQGSGLGLNLLKQICDLHGIAVSVKSEQEVVRTIENVPFSWFKINLKF